MTTSFGIDVKIALLKKGMTMTQLAKKLKISNAYLSDILSGKRDAKEQKKKIAFILNIPYKEVS